MRRVEDLTGKVFGYWTVLGPGERDKSNRARWLCKCKCGEIRTLRAADLRSGSSKSCGCFQRELIIDRNTTHGLYQHVLYVTWKDMCDRCYNPGATGYSRYGGRGITVCDEWRGPGGFPVFLKDMGEKPIGYTLDRIDNDGNYCPENCRWVSIKKQNRNKKTNRYITFRGVTRAMVDWAEVLDMSVDTLKNRLNKLKWSEEKALTTPVEYKFNNGRADHAALKK